MQINAERANKVASKQLFISCVVPVFNEEDNVQPFIRALNDYLKSLSAISEIIIVNDGSKDKTRIFIDELSQEIPTVKVLHFSRNFGKETAINAGLEHVSGEVTVIIDADFQHPFPTIHEFIEHWQQGYDMVYGLRTSRENESTIKRWFAHLFYRIMRYISQADIVPNAGDFRLLDKKVVQAIISSQERVRFMKGLYSWVGFSSIAVPFEVQDRQAGKSSWRFFKLFDLAITGVVSFSDVPLRVWSIIGFIIFVFSLLIILYIVIDTLIFGVDVPGYATLLSAIIFFGGIQLFSIGIVGEYIARIFNEVKQRPKYIVESKKGFKED